MPGKAQSRPVQRIRAGSATLAGAVLGFFYLLPLMANFVSPASGAEWLEWAAPLLGASAAAVWAWHSAFGCRLVGICTLLTSLLAFALMSLLPLLLFESPDPILTIALPIGCAAVGLLAVLAGSSELDRVLGQARRGGRRTRGDGISIG